MIKLKKYIDRLNRRKEWLDNRIADNPDQDLSYDKAESNALNCAIKLMEEEVKREETLEQG